MNISVSQSRTYVAMCSGWNFNGYYFKKFVLPEKDPLTEEPYKNDSNFAAWYFLNKIDFFSCIDGAIAFEDYQNLTDLTKDEAMEKPVLDLGSIRCECGHPRKHHQKFVDGLFLGCARTGCSCKKFDAED